MKILVTGGTGFLGSHLVEALIKKGHSVVCLVRNKKKLGFLNPAGVELKKGNLLNKKSLKEAIRGVDIVYHLAAISGKSAVPASLYQKVNILGTKNILEAAYRQKVSRFIFVSSNAVTGSFQKLPGDENTPYNPTNWYERSKAEGEKLVLEAIKKYNFPAVIIRPGTIYGPRNINSNLANFLKMACNGWLILPGKGENFWDMIYISDCVEGLLLAGEKKEAIGEIFILTGPKPAKVKEIVKTAALAAGKKLKIISLPVLPMRILGKIFGFIENFLGIGMPFSAKTIEILTTSRYHSCAKAKKILGFKPKISLKEGMTQTINWYKQIGFIK